MKYQKQQGPTKATILKSSTPGWIDIVTPYNKEFVETIKTDIEWSKRKWNPDSKRWSVDETYLEELVGMLKLYFDEIETDLLTTESDSNLFKQVFDILKGMPNGNMDKVYHALAQALHPDHGGSNEQMTLLNQAYQEIRK